MNSRQPPAVFHLVVLLHTQVSSPQQPLRWRLTCEISPRGCAVRMMRSSTASRETPRCRVAPPAKCFPPSTLTFPTPIHGVAPRFRSREASSSRIAEQHPARRPEREPRQRGGWPPPQERALDPSDSRVVTDRPLSYPALERTLHHSRSSGGIEFCFTHNPGAESDRWYSTLGGYPTVSLGYNPALDSLDHFGCRAVSRVGETPGMEEASLMYSKSLSNL